MTVPSMIGDSLAAGILAFSAEAPAKGPQGLGEGLGEAFSGLLRQALDGEVTAATASPEAGALGNPQPLSLASSLPIGLLPAAPMTPDGGQQVLGQQTVLQETGETGEPLLEDSAPLGEETTALTLEPDPASEKAARSETPEDAGASLSPALDDPNLALAFLPAPLPVALEGSAPEVPSAGLPGVEPHALPAPMQALDPEAGATPDSQALKQVQNPLAQSPEAPQTGFQGTAGMLPTDKLPFATLPLTPTPNRIAPEAHGKAVSALQGGVPLPVTALADPSLSVQSLPTQISTEGVVLREGQQFQSLAGVEGLTPPKALKTSPEISLETSAAKVETPQTNPPTPLLSEPVAATAETLSLQVLTEEEPPTPETLAPALEAVAMTDSTSAETPIVALSGPRMEAEPVGVPSLKPTDEGPSLRLVDQAAEATTHALQSGKRELHLQLKPEHMGDLRIHISSAADQRVSARLVVSNPDALALIQPEIDALQHAMESQGVQVDRIHVVLAGGGDSTPSNNSQEFRQQAFQQPFQQGDGSQQASQQQQNGPQPQPTPYSRATGYAGPEGVEDNRPNPSQAPTTGLGNGRISVLA